MIFLTERMACKHHSNLINCWLEFVCLTLLLAWKVLTLVFKILYCFFKLLIEHTLITMNLMCVIYTKTRTNVRSSCIVSSCPKFYRFVVSVFSWCVIFVLFVLHRSSIFYGSTPLAIDIFLFFVCAMHVSLKITCKLDSNLFIYIGP